MVLTRDGHHLLVSNVGSNQISVFSVHGARLRLLDVVNSQGQTPQSIAIRDHLVYVLNNGGTGLGNLATFFLHDDGKLSFIPGTLRSLSAAGSRAAQVAITPDGSTLVVTEEATNRIDTVPLFGGLPGPLTAHAANGITPFGIDFASNGVFVVTNASGGVDGQATATSYKVEDHGRDLRTISGSVQDFRSEVCWTLISKDERTVWVSNFGDGTISSYDLARDGKLTLRNPVAAATTFGVASIRDEELTPDGRYLYAIDIVAQKVFGWRVQDDGSLVFIGAVPGLNPTVAGIAVR
jgi:6-phosphogluconolactonase (cycloisomerase 2 family)